MGVLPDEFCSCPREMVAPAVLAWVEKPDEVVGGSLVSGDVRTFVPVAVQASQGKIVDGTGTSMLARDDVVDVKRQRIDGRRYVAIFATTFCSLPDLPDQVQVH